MRGAKVTLHIDDVKRGEAFCYTAESIKNKIYTYKKRASSSNNAYLTIRPFEIEQVKFRKLKSN